MQNLTQEQNPHYKSAQEAFINSRNILDAMLVNSVPPKGMKDNKALKNLRFLIQDYIEKIKHSEKIFLENPKEYKSVIDHKGRMLAIKFAYAKAVKMHKEHKLQTLETTITRESSLDNDRESTIKNLEDQLLANPNIKYLIINEETDKKGENNFILLQKNGNKISRSECTSKELNEYEIKKNESNNNGIFAKIKNLKSNLNRNKAEKDKEKTLETISSLKSKIDEYSDKSLKKLTDKMDESVMQSDRLTTKLFEKTTAYARHGCIQKRDKLYRKANENTINKLHEKVEDLDNDFMKKLEESCKILNTQINILSNQLTKYKNTLMPEQYSKIENEIKDLKKDLIELSFMQAKGNFRDNVKSNFDSLEINKKFDVPLETDNKMVESITNKFKEKKQKVIEKSKEVWQKVVNEHKSRNAEAKSKFDEISNKILTIDTKAHSISYDNKLKSLDNKINQLDEFNKLVINLNIADIETNSSDKNYLVKQHENLKKNHEMLTKKHNELEKEIGLKIENHPEIPSFESATGKRNPEMNKLYMETNSKQMSITTSNIEIEKNLDEVATTIKTLDHAIKSLDIKNTINSHEDALDNSINDAKIQFNKTNNSQDIEMERSTLKKLDVLVDQLENQQKDLEDLINDLEDLINEEGGIHYDRSRLNQATNEVKKLREEIEAQWDALTEKSIIKTFKENYEEIAPDKSGSVYFSKQANDNQYSFKSITEHAVKGSAVKNTLSRAFSSCCCLFGRSKNESEQDRDEQAEIGNRSTQTIYNMLNSTRNPRNKINIRAENKQAADDKITEVQGALIEQTKTSLRCS